MKVLKTAKREDRSMNSVTVMVTLNYPGEVPFAEDVADDIERLLDSAREEGEFTGCSHLSAEGEE